MKAKLFLLLSGIVVMSFVIIFSSCNKEEEPVQSASLLFNPDSTSFTGRPGETRSFQISASAPSGFEGLTVDKTVGGGSPVTLGTYTDDNGDNVVVVDPFTYTFDTADVGKTVVLTFTLSETGTAGVTATKNVTTTELPSPAARSYTAILLYAPLGDKSADSFFSTNTGATYSPDSVNGTADPLSADIDFGYYYGNTDNASLASPLAYSQLANTAFSSQVAGWGTLNDITFKLTDLTPSQFTELSTFQDIDDAYAAGTDPTTPDIVTALAANQVIAFATDVDKTGGSKKGLIMVSEIKGTFNQGDYIKLEILVQESAQ